MIRLTAAGPELEGFRLVEPAASIRLLLPSPGTTQLVIPEWVGNEFLLADGSRPLIRTFTPRRFDHGSLELDIDIVLHDGGAASAWVEQAGEGDPLAVSGPGRGYHLDPEATSYFLAGDETAIPAMAQLLEKIPLTVPVRVLIEIAHPDARLNLPVHPVATVEWLEKDPDRGPGSALVEAVTNADLESGARVWVAGEAGSLVPIRKYFRQTLGMDRSEVTVRGYWKHGR
jgi:NADPH-dependent ferric siderophore reductase